MRSRAFRRHQTWRHMWRRLKEDRNQHYENLDCPCWDSPGHMARFKEQPKTWSCYCCCNQRRNTWQPAPERLTMQERRKFQCDKFENNMELTEDDLFDYWITWESYEAWEQYRDDLQVLDVW